MYELRSARPLPRRRFARRVARRVAGALLLAPVVHQLLHRIRIEERGDLSDG